MNKKQIKNISIIVVIGLGFFGITVSPQTVENFFNDYFTENTELKVTHNDTSIPTSRNMEYSTAQLDPNNIRVIDGDTFIDESTNVTYRMYLVDTPESCHLKKSCKSEEEPNGKKASIFTQNAIKQANSITIEFDPNKKNRYGRELVWVFIDDTYLLQSMIIKEGLIDGFYNANGTFTEDINKTKFYQPYLDICQ